MSDWGLSVRGMHNVADASPLQFLRKIPRSEMDMESGASRTYDFTGQAPAGTQLLVLTDVAVLLTQDSIYVGYQPFPINITTSGMKVTVSLPNFGTGNWSAPNDWLPNGFWVFAIYGQPSRGDWGAWVNQGGAYPSVVNSSSGMFLTQKMTITLTGSYALNCSDNALVFCSCPDSGIGLYFNRATKTLTGYKSSGQTWGYPGGYSVQVKICIFDIKTPTIPDWGLLIRGADGGVAFTSAETPLIIREYVNVPNYVGAMNAFSSPSNTPMILPTCVGMKTTNQSDIWKVNLSTNGKGIGLGPGENVLHLGSPILNNLELIPQAGKSVPVIWGSDYF